MAPNSLTSVIIPRVMLFAGLAFAVYLVSANAIEEHRARQVLEAIHQKNERQALAYERCAADLKKSGNYGELLDLVADARCPEKPYQESTVSFNRAMKNLRATALQHAGIVALLAALPWLASRMRARARSAIVASPQ